MFLVLVRLGGIALGVITLLGFASGYLNVEFKPVFASVLKVLQEVAAVMVGAPLWEMLLDELRQHFAWLPKPEPHWKPIFTLSALLMLSMTRHAHWIMIPIALLCSFFSAVFAGSAPVGSLAVSSWSLMGFFAFTAILALLKGRWLAIIPTGWSALPFAALLPAAFVYYGGADGRGSSALVILAYSAGCMGLLFLVGGLLDAKGTLLQRLQTLKVATGLDITATLGLALALGYLLAA
ncbi:MAG: hypothetical protein ACK51S_05160 [Alphaproteobacteria bacterium]